MESTTLGRGGGPLVSRVGLGLMGMSGTYGPADDTESAATIRAALDAGITLLDTGDFYGMGHNEMLLASALRGVPRDSVFIQVKFGAQRDPASAPSGPAGGPWSGRRRSGAPVGGGNVAEPGVRAVHRGRLRQIPLYHLRHAGVVRVADVG